MHFKALIFDFDGTIADTLDEGLRIYDRLAEQHGFRRVGPEDFDFLRSLNTRQLFRHLGIPSRKLPFLLTQGRALLKARIRHLPLIDGMADVLPLLREKADRFGILTSNAVDNVEDFLDAHGLRDLFTFIDSTRKLTGKARHLRSIARTFALRPPQMLYVGDEVRDVRAAHKADLASAAVTWGFSSIEALTAQKPHFIAFTPADLLKIAGDPSP